MYYTITNYASLRSGCIVVGLTTLTLIILYRIIKETDINNPVVLFPLSEIMLHI
jgi:hypothetical protein